MKRTLNLPGYYNPGEIVEIIQKFGYNGNISTSGNEDVVEMSGLYAGQPQGVPKAISELVTVVSDNAADDVGSTGAETVRLYGLGEEGFYQTEDISLNGLSAVDSTKKWYRIWRVQVLTAGSGGANAGTITVAHKVTTANIFAAVQPGINSTKLAVFTVPKDMSGEIVYGNIEVVKTNTAVIFGYFEVRPYADGTGVWIKSRPFSASNDSPKDVELPGAIQVPELTDMRVYVSTCSANNTPVVSNFTIVLFDETGGAKRFND